MPWKQLFPYASNAARDLLNNLLQFDPEKRMTVEEALGHAYLESYHDVEDEVLVILMVASPLSFV